VEWEPKGKYATASGQLTAPTSGRLRATHRVIVRYPLTVKRCPLIVFSHSLGNQVDSYAEMSALWASRGFVVMHPCHADAISEFASRHPEYGVRPDDTSLGWRGLPSVEPHVMAQLYNPEHWVGRVEDVRGVIDHAPGLARDAGFGGEIDYDRVGVGGHSYGTFTAAQIAGMVVNIPGAGPTSLVDARAKAALVFSSPGPDEDRGMDLHAWDSIAIPMMCLNGSEDFGVNPEVHGLAWRRQLYDRMPSGGKYLATLVGVDHGFGGIARVGRGYFRDWPPTRRDVHMLTSAFWESTLNDSTDARDWLKAQVGVHPRWTVELK
jgi:dienelactone hydrolase